MPNIYTCNRYIEVSWLNLVDMPGNEKLLPEPELLGCEWVLR